MFEVAQHDKEEIKAFVKEQYNGDTTDVGKQAWLNRIKKKDERRKDIIKNYSCKKAVYENCKMLAPDGFCLSNCDRSKAQWYLDRKLATLICEEPLTVKLIFEPSNY